MANEKLTLDEVNGMLEMLSNPVGMPNAQGQIQGRQAMVPIQKIVEYRTKDNDVIRAELVVFRAKKAEAKAQAIAKLQAQLADIQAA